MKSVRCRGGGKLSSPYTDTCSMCGQKVEKRWVIDSTGINTLRVRAVSHDRPKS